MLLVMSDEEIWKDILGYEGYYQVSNLGRVKALRRKKATRWGNYFWLKETIKSPYPQEDGYLQIGLSKDGKKTNFLLHRLVGLAFIPGDTSLEINHIDFDRKNCRADNLEWETRQGNVEHSYSNGRYSQKAQRGVKTKLSVSDVVAIRTARGLITHEELSKKYGVSVGSISCIQRRVYWKHVA